jgi:hypothetical protein
MKLVTGQEVKDYMIGIGLQFAVDLADQSLFDLEIYAFNLPEVSGTTPFPESISSKNLYFEFNNKRNNEAFYLMCPYFSSENVNVSVSITPTFEELPTMVVLEQPQDCGQQDDSICETQNSDQIKEFIEKFEDPQEDILGTTIDVTTQSEDEQTEETFTVESNGGVFSQKEINIKAKLGTLL